MSVDDRISLNTSKNDSILRCKHNTRQRVVEQEAHKISFFFPPRAESVFAAASSSSTSAKPSQEEDATLPAVTIRSL